jgi:hypothetical protein
MPLDYIQLGFCDFVYFEKTAPGCQDAPGSRLIDRPLSLGIAETRRTQPG